MNQYSPFKGKTGFKRVINATQYSLSGFKSAFHHEAAFRQIIILNLILIPVSFFLAVSAVEQALMIIVCLLSVIVELFNSAIEAVVDRVSLEQHPLSKNAKDMGSAAQFVSLIIIIATWSIILIR
ncbi:MULTISPECIES: diacylglycerol kinase [unclassified Acinetobacter]|uniref:diacylglycerol kinase n=1 Tax=unclassified Acinetobacter TaxID=196816 RepID=UPI002934510B|nr:MULTISPECIES: diacylglycerol kinase [unclassified Acinetobacter]WOE31477.1 diacylglycerol kinase [Acinetobacter sp. SAAs470]WOE39673.1 diacylglycerol kinase [Acinetobacter sp. SAAs474]